MKTKKQILFLRIFSALLCFHFLNISVETHKHFLLFHSLSDEVIPAFENENENLLKLVAQATGDMENPIPENSKNAPDNDGEEEEKKCTDDDFFSPHIKNFVLSGDQNAHRFHGVSDTQEFISEIIPPPPKA